MYGEKWTKFGGNQFRLYIVVVVNQRYRKCSVILINNIDRGQVKTVDSREEWINRRDRTEQLKVMELS